MDSPGIDAPSSFTETDTSISEYDALREVEPPFAGEIPMMEEAYATDGRELEAAYVRGISAAQEYENSPASTDAEDERGARHVSDNAYSDDDEEDSGDGLQPLAHARQYGLTTSYLDEDPLKNACIPTPPASVLADFDLGPDADYMQSAKELMQQIGNERWNLDKDTAELLTSAMALTRADELEDSVSPRSMRDLKIEEPVLSSDPDMDLSKLKARNLVRLSTNGMVPYDLDVEKGESLSWTAEDLKLPSATEQTIANEKLDVEKETFELLREVMKPSNLDRWEAVELAIEADQSCKIRRETTPLLPLSPPLSSCAPTNQAHDMELTSSPENLFAQEAAEVEAVLLGDDNDPGQIGTSSGTLAGQDTSDDIRNFTKTPTTSSSSPPRQKRLRDLKADTPLLSQDPSSPPAKRTKTVSFPQELHTMIPAPDTDDSIMDAAHAQREIDEIVTNIVAPMAKSVIDQVGTENLDELDTTLRVNVPQVGDLEAVAPWEDTDDINKVTLSRFAKEIPPDRKKWSGISKLEQMVSWTPFRRYLGKVNLHEQFDDGSCERYLAELTLDDDRTDVEFLLWKPEGLRLLDGHVSDDDELEAADIDDPIEEAAVDQGGAELASVGESTAALVLAPAPAATSAPAQSSAPSPAPAPAPAQRSDRNTQAPTKQSEGGLTGMQALLQRRKLELETTSKPKAGASPVIASTMQKPAATIRREDADGNMGFSFANSGLHSFLGLQGAKTLDSDVLRVQVRADPLVAPSVLPEQSLAVPKNAIPPRILPVPKLSGSDRAVSIVVSSGMLANRQLVRELQAQLPTLELIERDPAILASRAQDSGNVVEADFTISPSAAIICTTLQKLKQRPLPGQSNFYGIRERIASVSPRYECCIVLISQGKQDGLLQCDALDEGDTAAICELTGFANSLATSIEVCYVAGGESDLAIWIAASICRRSTIDGDAKLLHDETIWERLLRSAGANPAAAQMILAKLKRPEIVESGDSSSNYCSSDGSAYGLHAFVQMSVEERTQRFGPVMGGERALQRISEVVDGRWMSMSGR